MGDFDRAIGEAFNLAREAGQQGDVPVGALVLGPDGRVLGRGRNTRDQTHDPLAHAEIMALREAAEALGSWNLQECTLVVSLEPCPMCAGASVMAHVGRIVFGAWDDKLGACGSVWDIPRDPHIGAVPEVVGGVREGEAAGILRQFFAEKR